jgi:hypothetical protein
MTSFPFWGGAWLWNRLDPYREESGENERRIEK